MKEHDMKERYADFLINYVSTGLTVNHEAMNDLYNITNEYLNDVYSTLDRDKFFTKNELKNYLEILQWNLQDWNIHYFCLRYDKQRYINCLIDMIKTDY